MNDRRRRCLVAAMVAVCAQAPGASLSHGPQPGVAPAAHDTALAPAVPAQTPQETPQQTPQPLQAISPDGRWIARADGEALAILDRRGPHSRRLPGRDLAGERHGSPQRILALPHRRSFLVSWPALQEWWELSWDPDAPPLFDGLVHDYRMGEAIASPGFLHPRRLPLPAVDDAPLTLEAAPPGFPWAAGMQAGELLIVHLDVRRVIARVALDGARPGDGAVQAATPAAPASWWVPGTHELLRVAPLHGGVLSREILPARGARLRVDTHGGLLACVESRCWRREAARDWQPLD